MLRWSLMLLFAALLAGCSSREFQQLDTERQAAWAALQPMYQQRAALSLNLLSSARALPTAPPAAFTRLELARGQALALPSATNPDDAALLQRHTAIQTELVTALAPLLVLARQQPGLVPLAQLFEGLDNRIRVQQQRYTLATQRYNALLQGFPSSLVAWLQDRGPRPVWPAGS
jgi:LemA protein